MRSPKIRVGAVFLLLIVLGASSSQAIAGDREVLELDSVRKVEEKPSPRLDQIFKFSHAYLAAGTGTDAFSTLGVMKHPTIARREDGTILANFHGMETGWAGDIGFGKQNAFVAVSANVALNFGIDMLSRRLYRRGGKWRMVAIALNVAKATDSVVAGVHNMRYGGQLDQRIGSATGYAGPIIWSSK